MAPKVVFIFSQCFAGGPSGYAGREVNFMPRSEKPRKRDEENKEQQKQRPKK